MKSFKIDDLQFGCVGGLDIPETQARCLTLISAPEFFYHFVAIFRFLIPRRDK